MRRGPGLQALELKPSERERLLEWTRRHKSSQALALRSRIVLGAAAGQSNREIAHAQRVTAQTVGKWRRRFLKLRLDGLLDEPRPGAPRQIGDELHPHVHLVLRAISKRGVRLNIKKATLRYWRSQFAHHLRELGVAANATERAVRGESRNSMKDGIYRASRRGESTYLRAQAKGVVIEIAGGGIRPEPGKRTLLDTRAAIHCRWQAVADKASQQGDCQLAADILSFSGRMNRPHTDREWVAQELVAAVRARQREARTL